jgi:hypothetical protein
MPAKLATHDLGIAGGINAYADELGANHDVCLAIRCIVDREGANLCVYGAVRHDALNDVGSAQELGNFDTERASIQLLGLVNLHDPSKLHHGNAIADGKRFFLIVRDEHTCEPSGANAGHDFAANVLARARVEVTKWLVEQQQLWALCDCANDGYALLLTTR